MPEPAQGFAIGVDLGTSNTVAVVRWPDGRTRPLLVDGAPIMPSGVYADVSGQLLVGRDAHRLAGLDPSRFEPNPKRRIDEQAVFLGGREIPTVDLLAALLAAVARAAVEAVGFLPPAVLTYPAAWGARRREILATAAARAGWPPVRLIPEPVAAARYFADVLRRPVPVGSSLAVFDFGGGTLDIAVVRNENGQFTVLGSGGIEDLGGLDIDNGIVEHLGGVLVQAAPDAWAAISNPDSTTQRRDRRLFWEDVRGAKEMLSRTAVAPITVAGRDQAIHLTREELDRVAEPLLRRAVWETGAVIQRCGLRPDQLAGLFLVGGSSRLPMVARLLHAELGVAPTVLEQPELPVAEGALAELAPPPSSAALHTGQTAYQSSAVPVSVHPAAPSPVSPAYGGPPGFVPAAPTSPPMPPPQAPQPPAVGGPRPWYRRRLTWIAGAAALLVLAVVATVAFVTLRGRVSEVEFTTLRSGLSVNIADASKVDGATTATLGDRAYYGWLIDKTLHMGAIDLKGDKPLWGGVKVEADARSWRFYALPDALVAISDGSSGPGALYVFDVKNGNERFHVPFGDRDRAYFNDSFLVLHLYDTKELSGRSWTTGETKWIRPNPKVDSSDDASMAGETALADFNGPGDFSGRPVADNFADEPKRLVQLGADKKFYLVDATNGETIREWNGVYDSSMKYFASDGKFFVTSDSPYRIQAYDLNKQGEPQTVYTAQESRRRVDTMVPCGSGRVCVLDTLGSDEKTTEVVTIDVTKQEQLWRKPAPGADLLVPMGDQVLATSTSGTAGSFLYSADGAKQLLSDEAQKSFGARVNASSLLFFSGDINSYGNGDLSLIGVSAATGKRTALGPLNKVRGTSCSWSESAIVCATIDKIQVWRFA
jgi:molecular chaperone HscA